MQLDRSSLDHINYRTHPARLLSNPIPLWSYTVYAPIERCILETSFQVLVVSFPNTEIEDLHALLFNAQVCLLAG